MKPQTFAEYLITKILPADVHVGKPVTKSELERILNEVYQKHESDYGAVVMGLKRLGDKFSTYESITMGIAEISPPNDVERTRLFKEYAPRIEAAKTDAEKIKHMAELQRKVMANDTGTDGASLMVTSGAMSGKAMQLVKLRSSPVMVGNSVGEITPVPFYKSYSEGQGLHEHYLQNIESRFNVAQGKLATASPGEISKVLANTHRSSVVSLDDCGTHHGLLRSTDTDLIGRYLAADAPPLYQYNTYISDDVLKKLRDHKVQNVLVRSPQTCEAQGTTVCAKCNGHSISTGKPVQIGDNVGLTSAGAMSEPLTQLALSAKHSSISESASSLLLGEKGLRQFIEMPKQYPNRRTFCEVYGVIDRILSATQGGKNIIIRGTQPVPERFILMGKPYAKLKGYWDYYVPPNINILKDIKVGTKVFPGMELTTGTINLQDIARLKGLGITRTEAAKGISDIYRNTNAVLDSRHFELLSRAAYNYLKMYQVPTGFRYKRGEVVTYHDFLVAIQNLPGHDIPVTDALGKTLLHPINDVTAGTTLTTAVLNHLKQYDIKTVTVTDNLQVEAVAAPMTRVPNLSDDWIATLNHRHLKDAITTAARTGQSSDIHGYNPIPAYAYGAELESGPGGKY